MNEYLQFKKKIQQRIEILSETIAEMEGLGFVEKPVAARWTDQLGHVRASLQDALLRIAVVGSVKSGKSTLINALLGRDLLKRGAGIITAFITRIHSNGEMGGWVELKPWSQVCDELNANLRMLPLFGEEVGEREPLDIRREEDRRLIRSWLEKTRKEWQHTGGQLDPSFVLLNGYLEGYDRLHTTVGESASRLIFDERSVDRHQHYVGHDGQALYVRDMELHYPLSWLGENVELADCQGSDSPNPLHFALLQQYLLRSHFILYVLSSRTGLREADFKLLDFIKTLRMFPQTLFVLNVDLDEHPQREDLDRMVDRVRTELSWVVPRPRLFAFSALYRLAEQLGEALGERERSRLGRWKEDQTLARATEEGFASFRDTLDRRISGQRARILIGSGLSRLGMIAGSLRDTTSAQKQFIDRNLGNLRKSSRQLKSKQKAFLGALGTLHNAISGLEDSLRQELDQTVDLTFDPATGPIVRETLDMVAHYPVERRTHAELGDFRQLVRLLHRFYLEFRQSLSRYLVEQVNVRVIEFAKEQEAFLEERFNQSSHAFWALYTTALEEFRREMAEFQIDLRAAGEIQACEWAFSGRIAPPTFSAFVDHEAVGRGVLLMKFGLGRFTRFLTGLKVRLGKKGASLEPSRSQEAETVQEAIQLVKSEAQSELSSAFRDYRKSFKRDYLHRMLEEGIRTLLEGFRARAEMAQLDFANLLKQSEIEGEGREAAVQALTRIGQITEAMAEELEGLGCAINLEWMAEGEEPGGGGREHEDRAAT